MQAVVNSFYIYIHNTIEIGFSRRIYFANMSNSGIVYQYINISYFFECRYYFLLISHITGM